MVFLGLTDVHGVAAVLGIAGVVCCAAGIAGDMMQDLKVGHILGGSPWRMQAGELVGVVFAAAVMTFPLIALHRVYTIGSAELPAPQAGLMALMANGIVAGDMAWPLVITGMFLAIGLILISAPAPMLIAVGMYLPFQSTAAIFAGGIVRWLFTVHAKRRGMSDDERARGENTGVLLSSGFIAGESLMAVILALLVIGGDFAPWLLAFQRLTAGIEPSFWLSLAAYPLVIYLLVFFAVPLGGGSPAFRRKETPRGTPPTRCRPAGREPPGAGPRTTRGMGGDRRPRAGASTAACRAGGASGHAPALLSSLGAPNPARRCRVVHLARAGRRAVCRDDRAEAPGRVRGARRARRRAAGSHGTGPAP
jgi:hypothetical protein